MAGVGSPAMLIVALVNQKGGAGKTTVAVNLAAEWLRAGRRVLLVDADPQGTARTWRAVAGELGEPAPDVVTMGAELWEPERLPRLARSYERVVIDCPPRMNEVQRAALAVADVAVVPSGPGQATLGRSRSWSRRSGKLAGSGRGSGPWCC